MKIQILKAGLVLGALIALPAFAEGDDARIDSTTQISNDIAVSGKVKVKGTIQVKSESAATVDQDQMTAGNASFGDGDHDAHMGDSALAGAQGNIGANVAAGVGNVQANNGALSAVDGKKVFASAMTFNSQQTEGNLAMHGRDRDGYHAATLDGDALAGAKGNIGVNVVAGVGNAQSNAMAASVNSSGTIAKAASDSEQTSLSNELLAGRDLDTFAVLGGNALAGAQGNIGVNVAAGVGNAQHNGLAIASASCGACAPPPPPPPPPTGGCGPGDRCGGG